MWFEKYPGTSVIPTVNVLDLILSLNETSIWILSDINAAIRNSELESVQIVLQTNSKSSNSSIMMGNPEITIQNSSCGSLDLKPGTKAKITDCYIDARYSPRPTLITANNAVVLIQNCYFKRFSSENGSTILHGQNSSLLTVANSSFTNHNGDKGIILLHDNCSAYFVLSGISGAIVSSRGFSAITLNDHTKATIKDSSFTNDSAMIGGSLSATGQGHVKLENCTFSLNEAEAGGALAMTQNTILEMIDCYAEKNKAVTNPALGFGGVVFLKNEGQVLIENTSFIENTAIHGGAISIEKGVQLMVKSCIFDNNTAKGWHKDGDLQPLSNKTTIADQQSVLSNKFLNRSIRMSHVGYERKRNKPSPALTVNKQTTASEIKYLDNLKDLGLRFKTFNKSMGMESRGMFSGQVYGFGGAILAFFNTTLEIWETEFTSNKADSGGCINIQKESFLSVQSCLFHNNSASDSAGAISITNNVTSKIHETNLTGNNADFGGSIYIQLQSVLYIESCTFHRNLALYTGGAIAMGNGATLNIIETCVMGNSATAIKGAGGAIGGGHHAQLHIKNSNFTGNSANNGGGIDLQHGSSLGIENSFFHGNSAPGPEGAGGAIVVLYETNLYIQGTSFMDNTAAYGGGAIGGLSVAMVIMNSIFKGNSANQKDVFRKVKMLKCQPT